MMSFVAPLPPSEEEVTEIKKVEVKPIKHEKDDGFKVGDPCYYWINRPGGDLECNFALLTRRLPYFPEIPDSGQWQLSVLIAPGIWAGYPAGVPFSEVPKSGHWTLMD